MHGAGAQNAGTEKGRADGDFVFQMFFLRLSGCGSDRGNGEYFVHTGFLLGRPIDRRGILHVAVYGHRIFQEAESLEICHLADGLYRGGQFDLGRSHGMERMGSGFCAAGHLFYHALFGLHHCGRSEIKAPRIYDLFSDGRSVRTDSIYSLAGRRGTDGISIHSLQWMQLLIFGRTRHIQIKGIRCGTP